MLKKSFHNLLANQRLIHLMNVLSNPTSRHLLSRFVNVFPMSVNTNHLKEAWAKDFGVDLSDEIRNDCLGKIQYCSINARHRLTQFKVVHKLYYSKVRLNKIYNTISPICDRCKVTEGTLSHLFCFGPNLFDFWSSIFDFFFFFKYFSKGCEAWFHSSNCGDFWGTEHFFKLSTTITVAGYGFCQKDNTFKLEIFRCPFFSKPGCLSCSMLYDWKVYVYWSPNYIVDSKLYGSPSLISSSLSNLLLCKTLPAVFNNPC